MTIWSWYIVLKEKRMSAKTYDKKTAAFCGFVIQNMPNGLTDEIMQGWMDNPPATKKLLAGFVPPEVLLLSVVATTRLDAVEGKKNAKSFTDGWYYRNDAFDRCFGENQPDADACTVSACAVGREWLFAEAARTLPGVERTSNIAVLGRSLIACGYILTLPQIENLKVRKERGEETNLRTDGYANFFFVETGDPENPVSVADVFRYDSRWYADVYRLDNDYRWNADHRLLVRNLVDASKL